MELYSRIRVKFPPEETMFRRASADVWSIMFEPFEDQFNDYSATDTIIEYPHSTYTNSTVGDTYLLNDGGIACTANFRSLKSGERCLTLPIPFCRNKLGNALEFSIVGRRRLPLNNEPASSLLPRQFANELIESRVNGPFSFALIPVRQTNDSGAFLEGACSSGNRLTGARGSDRGSVRVSAMIILEKR